MCVCMCVHKCSCIKHNEWFKLSMVSFYILNTQGANALPRYMHEPSYVLGGMANIVYMTGSEITRRLTSGYTFDRALRLG